MMKAATVKVEAMKAATLKKATMKTGMIAAALTMVLAGSAALAQGTTPPATPKAQGPAAPVAAVKFPPVSAKNFTASSPTAAEVESFLKALWGYDENRTWSVAAILKTPAPGVARVVVYISDKSQPGKASQANFYTTPDGQHAIADQVIDFGARPFEANRKLLQARADGPSEGAAAKDLELVEFADLQCPHCKDAQETMNKLAQDFPQARIVYENFPLSEIHPYAFRAAAEGVCVRKAKGDAAFFIYAQAVYNKQEALTPESADAALASAVTSAGGDPAAAAACAETPAAKDEVKASTTLATDLGVEQTPTLAVNGHLLPLGGIPYETLKKIVAYQAGQDGVAVRVQPTLSNLK